MYARLVEFKMAPGKWAEAQPFAIAAKPIIAAHDGCESVTVFGDDTDGAYGIFVLWDSKEHADSAAMAVRPKLNELLSGLAEGELKPRLFEVLTS